MPYELFLALRYLRGRGRRRAARVTAAVAIVGIACGVAALVVALALANGFRDEMRDKILRGTAHITLARADGGAIRDWQQLSERLRGVEGVTDAAPTSYEGVLLTGPQGAAYAVVRGIDAASARERQELRRTLTAGDVAALFQNAHSIPDDNEPEPPSQVIIGEELAARTGLTRAGDEGWIVTGDQLSLTPQLAPRSRRVRVAGLFRTGLHDYDASWLYVALPVAANIAGLPDGSAPVISLETYDIYQTSEVAVRVRQVSGNDFTIVDWQEANRPLFAALALERRVVALIITLIMLVAALNITTTLVLVVVERRAEIAILGALGARPLSVMLIFMLEGAIIGAIGSVSGLALGLLACFIGDRYALVRLPAEVYALDSIPFHPRLSETLLAALIAFLICLVATIYPARSAARTRPAETLRYE